MLALLVIIAPFCQIYAQNNAGAVQAASFTQSKIVAVDIAPFRDNGVTVLFNDGSIYLYQYDENGGADKRVDSRVAGVSNVKKLIDATSALTNDGQVLTWGADGQGGKKTYQALPVQGISNVVDATSHYYLTKTQGDAFEVKYLDSNTEGATPLTLFSVTGAQKIADSEDGGVLLKSDGTVWKWKGTQSALTQIEGLSGIVDITSQAALDSAGNVWVWGVNLRGKLGNSDTSQNQTAAVQLLQGSAGIAGSSGQTYSIQKDGTLLVWGEANAQSGDTLLSAPTRVEQAGEVSKVFPATHGVNSTYLLLSDGRVQSVGLCGYAAVTPFTSYAANRSLLEPKTAVIRLNKDLSGNLGADELDQLPCETLIGTTAAGGTVQVRVESWECETSFYPDAAGTYIFRPVVSLNGMVVYSEYRLADEILPSITVTVEGGRMSSSSYAIDENEGTISKIAAGTNVASLLSGIRGGTVKAYDAGGGELAATDTVGTGAVVKLLENGQVKQSLTVVVTGDTNGDGRITITDVVRINAHVVGRRALNGVYALAAETNGDGRVTITDVVRVNAHVVGRKTLDPIAV